MKSLPHDVLRERLEARQRGLDCIPESTLSDLAAGTLTGDDFLRARMHLGTCLTCLQAYASLRRLLEVSDDRTLTARMLLARMVARLQPPMLRQPGQYGWSIFSGVRISLLPGAAIVTATAVVVLLVTLAITDRRHEKSEPHVVSKPRVTTSEVPPDARVENARNRDEAAAGKQKAETVAAAKQAAVAKEREHINAELRTQVADFCVKVAEGRYPFVRSSNFDIATEDFGRLFAQDGLLDRFFQKYLAQQVDTGQTPWRFKDPAIGQPAALAEFQRAQVIRDVFFRGGVGTPSIQLDFKPIEMDATIQQFTLDVDGKPVKYSHGPQNSTSVQFPGPGGRSLVRASIAPTPPSGTNGVRFEGPWALFRMFDGVQIVDTRQSERFVATFNIEGRRTVFEIYASSVRNPFRLPELNQFRCPTAV